MIRLVAIDNFSHLSLFVLLWEEVDSIMITIGSKVVATWLAPQEYSRFGLHRDCIGKVISISGDNITVDWNPNGIPQRGTYASHKLTETTNE